MIRRPATALARYGTAVALAAALLAGASCGDDPGPSQPGGGPAPAAPVPDFALRDVNPTSPTYDREVSPRDHLGRVSAWYFGAAT